jgi:hypothetical protein
MIEVLLDKPRRATTDILAPSTASVGDTLLYAREAFGVIANVA